VAKKYDYSQGDADVISALSIVSAGFGFAVVAESHKCKR
jgi:hypothetical protein